MACSLLYRKLERRYHLRRTSAQSPNLLPRRPFRKPPGPAKVTRTIGGATPPDPVSLAATEVDKHAASKAAQYGALRAPCGSGNNVIVFGLGSSGTEAAKLADHLGHTVLAIDEWRTPMERDEVFPSLSTKSPLECWWGEPPMEALDHCDLLVVSPGVSVRHKFVQAALAQQTLVTSELAYAMDLLPPTIPTIAITGTNGKSTTTAFVCAMLCDLGLDVWVGGNFGQPVSTLAAAVASGEPHPDAAVIEVSSYQLEAPGCVQPYAAAVLNLSSDHLYRHGSMQEYACTKMRLVSRMPPGAPKLVSPEALACARGIPSTLADDIPELKFDCTSSWVSVHNPHWSHPQTLDLSGLRPVGQHNRKNAAAAAFLASAVVGESRWDELQSCIPKLTSLPHRLETIYCRCGVSWISDSKATNVNAVMVALEAIPERTVILLGGQGKEDSKGLLGFAALPLVCGQHEVITFGSSGKAISAELASHGFETLTTCKTLADAVYHTQTVVKRDPSIKIVLLSPGCASFDEFKNFEERGRAFADLAKGQV